MTNKEMQDRIEALENSVNQQQLSLAQVQIDVHMLKLINKVLTEVNK